MHNEFDEIWQAMRPTKYTKTLNELKTKVNNANNIDDVINPMLESFIKATHAEAGTFWYLNEDEDVIYARAASGGGNLDHVKLKIGTGIVGSVIESNKSELIHDCSKDDRWSKNVDSDTGFKTQSMICVPLCITDSNSPFGAIQIINKIDGDLFDKEDLNFATSLATEIVRLFMENADKDFLSHLGKRKINLGIDKLLNYIYEDKMIEHLKNTLSNSSYEDNVKQEIEEQILKLYRLLQVENANEL